MIFLFGSGNTHIKPETLKFSPLIEKRAFIIPDSTAAKVDTFYKTLDLVQTEMIGLQQDLQDIKTIQNDNLKNKQNTNNHSSAYYSGDSCSNVPEKTF